ncbi:MAG TPA: ribose-5-phosphate isomerase RpiA [Candidatus Sulfotelmatobacter sp.]|jgi:ribose 5-phosphate isomerase A
MANDQEKEAAARASLQFVKDGQVVGLGTGSTAAYFIQLLGERVKNGLRVRGIPTSVRSKELAESLGIPLTTLDECQEIAVTVDGADEVDPQLRLIKGGGGAMLREKIVASATRQMIVVADASKQVKHLGKFPLPVEVIRFAQALIKKRIEALGADVQLRLGSDGKPYVTDENHHILDCRFGEIRDPEGLACELSAMPGLVEHGLFIGMASVALFARGSEIVEWRREGEQKAGSSLRSE